MLQRHLTTASPLRCDPGRLATSSLLRCACSRLQGTELAGWHVLWAGHEVCWGAWWQQAASDAVATGAPLDRFPVCFWLHLNRVQGILSGTYSCLFLIKSLRGKKLLASPEPRAGDPSTREESFLTTKAFDQNTRNSRSCDECTTWSQAPSWCLVIISCCCKCTLMEPGTILPIACRMDSCII